MTDDFILKWDAQQEQLYGEDPDTGNRVPVPIEDLDVSDTVNTDQIDNDGSGSVDFLSPVSAPSLGTDGARFGRVDEFRFASAEDGADVDTRLDNAIAAASAGDRVFLENSSGAGSYSKNRTIGEEVTIVSPNYGGRRGARLAKNTTWTLNGRVRVLGLDITEVGASITVDNILCILKGVKGGEITIKSDIVKVLDSDYCTVTFESGTAEGLVDSSSRMTVTDNGSNTVGDIS